MSEVIKKKVEELEKEIKELEDKADRLIKLVEADSELDKDRHKEDLIEVNSEWERALALLKVLKN